MTNVTVDQFFLITYGNNYLRTFLIESADYINFSQFNIMNLMGSLLEIQNSFNIMTINEFFIENCSNSDVLMRIYDIRGEGAPDLLTIENLTILDTLYAENVIEMLSCNLIVEINNLQAYNNMNMNLAPHGYFISAYIVRGINLSNLFFINNQNFQSLIWFNIIFSSILLDSKFFSNHNCQSFTVINFCDVQVQRTLFENNDSEFEPILQLLDDNVSFLDLLSVTLEDNFTCYTPEALAESLEFLNNSLILKNFPISDLSTVILSEFAGNFFINFSIFENNIYDSLLNSDFINGSPCLYSSQPSLSVVINGSKFLSNSGLFQSNCIFLASCQVTIENSEFFFNNNQNLNMGFSQGGALDLTFCNLINVSNSSFLGNFATSGGAILIEIADATTSSISFSNITGIGNVAIRDGGFLSIVYQYNTEFTFEFSSSIITDNFCMQGGGGAFSMSGFSPNVDCIFDSISNIFRNNSATNGGGVFFIYSNFCPSTFFQNIFEENSDFSKNEGGGVFFTNGNCQITTINCFFNENHGGSSSDICLANNLKALSFLDNSSVFSNSNATAKMIDLKLFSYLILNNSIFSNIFFNNDDYMINCGGESIAEFTNLIFINITAIYFQSLIVLSGNSNFLLNESVFFNISINGSILSLFEYLNNQEISIYDNVFSNIMVNGIETAFDVSNLNDGRISFENIFCQNYFGLFLKAANSDVILRNFKVKNFQIDKAVKSNGFFEFYSCNFVLEDIFFFDYGLVDCDYILGFYYSEGDISKIFVNKTLLDSQLNSLISISYSTISIEFFSTNNILSDDYFIKSSNGNLSLNNFSVMYENYTYRQSNFLSCQNCLNLIVSNGLIFGLFSPSAATFYIDSADTTSQIHMLNISVVENVALFSFAPLFFQNAFVNITNSDFIKNDGFQGGSLYLSCSVQPEKMRQYCSFNLNKCRFINNSAFSSGGGFYWNNFLPVENECIFVGNEAPIGENKSSNTIKICLKQGPPSILFSGEMINDPKQNLSFIALDYYDQITETNEESTYLTLNFYANNSFLNISKFLGNDLGFFEMGTANYSKYGVITKPNNTIELLFSTDLISYFSPFIIPDNYHKNYDGQYYFALNFSIRPCILGEIFSEKDYTCQACKINYYSLDLNDKGCKPCMPNAICHGGSSIEILSGFWRSDISSDAVYRCNILKYGCKGGFDNDLCSVGYYGPLCGVCVYNSTDKYFRSAMGYCELCKESNFLYAISAFIIMFVIFMLLIYFSIHESYEYSNSFGLFNNNDITVLMNIFINYIQKISIISNIEIKWPNSGANSNSVSIFYVFDTMTGVLECPFSEFALMNNYHLFSLTRMMSTVVFFAFVFGSLLFWILKGLWRKILYKERMRNTILDNMIITLIAVYVMGLQPMLNYFTKSLYCVEINGKLYLKLSTNLECWQGEHLQIVKRLILSVSPFLIGPPLLLLYYITKNRFRRNNKRYLLISYLVTTGYHRKYFYWEYILLFVKIVLMLLSIFLDGSPIICVMWLLLVFFLFIHIQFIMTPFDKPIYNRLEILKVSAIYFSYASNFFFFYEDDEHIISLILVLVELINGSFIVIWLYLFYRNIKQMIISGWRSFLSYCILKLRCKKNNKNNNTNLKSNSLVKETKKVKNNKRKKMAFPNKKDQLELI